MLISEFMTRDPVTVTPDDTVLTVYERLRAGHFRHLPVIEGERLTGIVTDRDLRRLLPIGVDAATSENWLHRLSLAHVRDIMTRDPVTGWPDMAVEEAARVLYEEKFGSLPIVENDRLVGIITDNDIFRIFVTLTGVLDPSSRLTIVLSGEDDPITRAIDAIHETGVPIVSVLTEPGAGNEKRRLVARVATVDPRRVIEALRSRGFAVHWDGRDEES